MKLIYPLCIHICSNTRGVGATMPFCGSGSETLMVYTSYRFIFHTGCIFLNQILRCWLFFVQIHLMYYCVALISFYLWAVVPGSFRFIYQQSKKHSPVVTLHLELTARRGLYYYSNKMNMQFFCVNWSKKPCF